MALEDRNGIRAAKARYCRFLDVKNWLGFEALFTHEAKISVFDVDGNALVSFRGGGEFSESAQRFLTGARSIHQVHNEEFSFESPSAASVIWSMEDYIVYPDARRGEPSSIHGYGHYLERWEDRGDGWQISSLELRRTILETIIRS